MVGFRESSNGASIPQAFARDALPQSVANSRASKFLWNYDAPSSGETVREDDALCIDTVFACVNVLSQAIASLPLSLFKVTRSRTGVETKLPARNHPLHGIVKRKPHAEFTSFRLRQHVMVQVLIRGNSIVQILRDDSGAVTGLYPLLWERTALRRRESTGELVYEYARQGSNGRRMDPVVLLASEVLHIRGISDSGGLVGMSVIGAQREALGLTKAVEQHGGKTFAHGARPTGALEVPEELSDEAFQRLRESWTATQAGVGNAGKTPILEGGTKFSPMSMSNDDAQFLETRKYQREQIAALFRIPAHLINDLENATYSNIEQQDLGFVKHTLLPWLINIEQEMDCTLLTEAEMRNHYFRHNVSGLERGDFATRTAGLATMINAAIITPNEARAKEEMNAHPDGDALLGNGTLTPVAKMGEDRQPTFSLQP